MNKYGPLLRALASAMLAASGGLIGLAATNSCTGTPDERAAKAAKVELDLCRLRASERAVEAVVPGAAPAASSVRAQIETAEDAFCATRLSPDAGK